MPKTPKEKQEGTVTVRVTKFGDGKVATGDYEVGTGDVFAKKDDTMVVAISVANELEKRALAEIVD